MRQDFRICKFCKLHLSFSFIGLLENSVIKHMLLKSNKVNGKKVNWQ